MNRKSIMEKILDLPPKQAEEWELKSSVFRGFKKRIRDKGDEFGFSRR
jgi:hypothetical protein